MPYDLSLQKFTPPEFYRRAPEEWVRRLAEISPDLPNLDRLVFRYFEPTNPDGSDRGWQCNERGQWTLYTARPIRLVEKGLAELYQKHWSEVPLHPERPFPQAEQEAHKAVVSDYQHFMWHSQGVYVKPFLILQGPWGGTPAKYTKQERAFLVASDCFADPFPIGSFPACPFDERVVKQITMRDRLLQVSNSYESLEKLDSSAALKAVDDAAEMVKRETYLDTWKVMIQPSVDFMKHFLKRSENRESLPRAPEGLANSVGQWREHWMQHGSILGVNPAGQRQIR